MARQPLAKGRLAYVAEAYASHEIDPQTRAAKMKNRYATLGRVTAWPAENGSPMPQISIDLDALSVGISGSTKLFIFWDDANQQSYDQQPQSYGTWNNAPQQPAPPAQGFNQQPQAPQGFNQQQNRPRN
ncbi:hypothetical protein [Marinomonas transparens]|uniref:Uncharacterized protein n=1 Tax=Marinomonas transparens TaxID=2795388 RepID=A0A934JZ05_9GAMM|nr:hypothetical protein [Marinomonas transparens]MBJ7539855.1 hypothetical protein [Marinomonas transparens]